MIPKVDGLFRYAQKYFGDGWKAADAKKEALSENDRRMLQFCDGGTVTVLFASCLRTFSFAKYSKNIKFVLSLAVYVILTF